MKNFIIGTLVGGVVAGTATALYYKKKIETIQLQYINERYEENINRREMSEDTTKGDEEENKEEPSEETYSETDEHYAERPNMYNEVLSYAQGMARTDYATISVVKNDDVEDDEEYIDFIDKSEYIDEEDEDYGDYDKLTIHYCIDDQVFIEDDGDLEVLNDRQVKDKLGPFWERWIDDDDIIYIRNYKYHCDIQIILEYSTSSEFMGDIDER